MKTQISRDGYRRDKRYSGVYQQQGRLITDSDWNELVDTVKARVDDALVDVIGTGSPKTGAAGIVMSGTTPKIIPGTVYAGGVEARIVPLPGMTSPFFYHQQADFPAAPPLPPVGTAYRIYADVWDRSVGALEDDGLRDPALHGADTTTRTQVMAQVKWCPVTKNPENPADNPSQGDARMTIKYPSGGSQATADACDPKAQEVDPVGGDFLFRVEVHDAHWAANAVPSVPDRVVIKWSRENGAEQYAFADMPDWFTTGPWIYELYDVDSERHLGFHPTNTNWPLKRGTLTSTLPATALPGTMVRRWEGYLVLVSSNLGWTVSTANGEKIEDTAAGTAVQWNDGVMTASLADLEFSLQVVNRVFLPGDFWSTPVRRATYQAGKELLKNALPQGIVHRYVTLAEVQTNNTLKARSAQEQRKLAFPRLSELDAGDMGYSTNCSSGLFDSNHDTVKKALDRLCSIGAVHVGYAKPSDNSVYKGNAPATVKDALDLLANVTSDDIGYTTTCTSGLFDNTHNTVEKALNRLCAINATHVGFTKPADTSVFQGATPTTVAQALGLLADVKSQQISYAPGSNPAVHDVKAALDELYARPVGNGSRVYIGPAGQYASIDVAVTDLLSKGKKDIALALLPGDHQLPGWNPGDLSGVHINILGLGRAARVHAQGMYIDRAASFHLHQVHLIFENNNAATFTHCGEVSLSSSIIEGSKLANKGLLNFDQVARVVVQDNLIDSQWETLDPFIVAILGLDAYENIQDLFSVGLTEFRTRALTLAQTLFNLPAGTRNPLGSGIVTRANANNSLNTEERATYVLIGNSLQNPAAAPWISWEILVQSLETLRYQLYVKNPGSSFVFSIYTGPTVIRNNHIRGLISLLQAAKASTNFNGIDFQFLNYFQGGRFSFTNLMSTMQVIGNVMAGIRGGDGFTTMIRNAILNNSFWGFAGAFRVLDVTDNVIENEENLFLAAEVNLHGNQFTPLNQSTLGWVVAQSGLYSDNRARWPNGFIYNGVPNPNGNTLAGTNLRINIVSVIIP